jgi:transcriptional regulator with XRE-family HTH domain
MQTIGERLKSLRKQSKMTQDDLADLLPVSRVTVSQWESNSNRLAEYEHVILLSKIFKVTPDYIYYGIQENLPIINNCYPLIEYHQGFKKIINKIETVEFYNADSFFVTIQDESMASTHSQCRQFFKGDMVLVYPSESPKDGDYVLARHKEKDIVAVRYYLAQGGIVLLRVGNSIFESLNGNLDTYEILGVVKQQIVRFE